MRRRAVLMLLVVYALSRLLLGWAADHPELYTDRGYGTVVGDISLYRHWASVLLYDVLGFIA